MRSFKHTETLWRPQDVAALAAAGTCLRHLDLGLIVNAEEMPASLLSSLTQLTSLSVSWPEYVDRHAPMPAVAQCDFRRLPRLQSLTLHGTGVEKLRGATALTALTRLFNDALPPLENAASENLAAIASLIRLYVRPAAGRVLDARRHLLVGGHAEVQRLLPALAAAE